MLLEYNDFILTLFWQCKFSYCLGPKNTSAPIRISDYISTKLVNQSDTPNSKKLKEESGKFERYDFN